MHIKEKERKMLRPKNPSPYLKVCLAMEAAKKRAEKRALRAFASSLPAAEGRNFAANFHKALRWRRMAARGAYTIYKDRLDQAKGNPLTENLTARQGDELLKGLMSPSGYSDFAALCDAQTRSQKEGLRRFADADRLRSTRPNQTSSAVLPKLAGESAHRRRAVGDTRA
jgi:hypothetical protein